MFKIGDVVTCVDNTLLEESFSLQEEYTVDKVFDKEHVSVKGFFGMIHSDRFIKKGSDNV